MIQNVFLEKLVEDIKQNVYSLNKVGLGDLGLIKKLEQIKLEAKHIIKLNTPIKEK
jgi:hypothetical protein|tara:strand:+ start:321 stop:488 length:168 start_codon:yes stop_codon:yes gene_type:complete